MAYVSPSPAQDALKNLRDKIMEEKKCSPGEAMKIINKQHGEFIDKATAEANRLARGNRR